MNIVTSYFLTEHSLINYAYEGRFKTFKECMCTNEFTHKLLIETG